MRGGQPPQGQRRTAKGGLGDEWGPALAPLTTERQAFCQAPLIPHQRIAGISGGMTASIDSAGPRRPLQFDRLSPTRTRMQRNLLLTSLMGIAFNASVALAVGGPLAWPTIAALGIVVAAVLLCRVAPSWGAVWVTQCLLLMVTCQIWITSGTEYREISYAFFFAAAALAAIPADIRAMVLFVVSLVVATGPARDGAPVPQPAAAGVPWGAS